MADNIRSEMTVEEQRASVEKDSEERTSRILSKFDMIIAEIKSLQLLFRRPIEKSNQLCMSPESSTFSSMADTALGTGINNDSTMDSVHPVKQQQVAEYEEVIAVAEAKQLDKRGDEFLHEEELLRVDGTIAAHYMIDKMSEPNLQQAGVQQQLEASFPSEMEAVEVAHKVFDELTEPVPTGLQSSFSLYKSSKPIFSSNKAGNYLIDEKRQLISLKLEGMGDAHQLFDEIPMKADNRLVEMVGQFYPSKPEVVKDAHLMFDEMPDPISNKHNREFYLSKFECLKNTKHMLVTITKLPPAEQNEGIAGMILFDPGGGSWHRKGCGFTESNSVKQNFNKMPNNLSVELRFGKMLMFVFDPGGSLLLYIGCHYYKMNGDKHDCQNMALSLIDQDYDSFVAIRLEQRNYYGNDAEEATLKGKFPAFTLDSPLLSCLATPMNWFGPWASSDSHFKNVFTIAYQVFDDIPKQAPTDFLLSYYPYWSNDAALPPVYELNSGQFYYVLPIHANGNDGYEQFRLDGAIKVNTSPQFSDVMLLAFDLGGEDKLFDGFKPPQSWGRLYSGLRHFDIFAQIFVWDPGQVVIFFHILEDKDNFKRVGKDIVLMDTILKITVDSKALRKSSVRLLKQNMVYVIWQLHPKFGNYPQATTVCPVKIIDTDQRIKVLKTTLVQQLSKMQAAGFREGSKLCVFEYLASFSVIEVDIQTFVWDPGLVWAPFRFSTLRTRCSFRGGICHDMTFYYNFNCIFEFTYLAFYDVIYLGSDISHVISYIGRENGSH